jgi:hypothetical protein
MMNFRMSQILRYTKDKVGRGKQFRACASRQRADGVRCCPTMTIALNTGRFPCSVRAVQNASA